MTDREVPFDEKAVCDVCGAKGAFDFLGDYLCPKCARRQHPNIARDLDESTKRKHLPPKAPGAGCVFKFLWFLIGGLMR